MTEIGRYNHSRLGDVLRKKSEGTAKKKERIDAMARRRKGGGDYRQVPDKGLSPQLDKRNRRKDECYLDDAKEKRDADSPAVTQRKCQEEER